MLLITARRPVTRFMAMVALALPLAAAIPASADSVGELTRLQGQGKSRLRGMGLVTGLNGTGDQGKDAVLARPLAELMRSNGQPVPTLDELRNSKSVALVLVEAVIDEGGARMEDSIDVVVSTVGSATSLLGGRLYLTAMQGPLPYDEVLAIASGPVEIETPSAPRVGRVRAAATLMKDIKTSSVDGSSFVLMIRPPYAGWEPASAISSAITQAIYGRTSTELQGVPAIATALDDRSIRVDIPPAERGDRAAFIADVLSTDVKASLLRLPPQVIYNRRTGMIVLTGDVRISPVVVSHNDIVVTTTLPPPVPTPLTPVVETSRFVPIDTERKEPERTKLQDLLTAMKQLNVKPEVQIEFIEELHRMGRLHAKLLREE